MKLEPKVAFHTLGCKLNQAETELLVQQFSKAGYSIADDDEADICILNTCTVTHIADRKSRHLVRLLQKINPEALIVATGCYAERASDELVRIGADVVVGNEQKAHLLEMISGKLMFMPQSSSNQGAIDGISRVRSFIKIQDGCNDFCTYCIVPKVRGQEYCLTMAEVIDEVRSRIFDGYKEVVLTGTKIGTYKCNGANLRQLIERILADTGVERLHLSSLQPQEITVELLSLWQNARLCHHFHLALQSGSDAVLRRMRRSYSVANYRKAVTFIRKAVPDAAITTDIMVGFPGESDEEFKESYRFCEEIDFANIHVFSYSPRPGTLAAGMTNQVKEPVKKEHSLRMLELAQKSACKFCQRFIGQTLMVLWEREVAPGSGVYSGLTHNYVRVFTESCDPLTNQILPVQLVKPYSQGLRGDVIK